MPETERRMVVVVGSGPAGLTAALYTARAQLQPLVIEGEPSSTGDQPGGQLMITTDVENYPGFVDGIMGPDLMGIMRNQALRFNAELRTAKVSRLDLTPWPFEVWVGDPGADEPTVLADTLIVATGARALMLGVYSPELTRTIADALVQLGADRAYVVHGAGGIDELSPCGPNLVCEVENGRVREYELDPLDLGVERCDPRELRGGDPPTNAEALRGVLAGADGGHRSAVILNAAGGIAAAGRAENLREGIERAREAIDGAGAAARLEELIAFSREEVPA